MQAEFIPIHDFSKAEKSNLYFRHISLNQRSDYDISQAHRHSYYEIFLFAKGGGHHEIDFEVHPIKDQTIHFVSPGQVHKVRREPDSYGSILLFSKDFYHFGAKADLSLFEYPFLNTQMKGTPWIELRTEQFEELQSLSGAMGREKDISDASSIEVIRTYLHIFLLKCKQFSEVSGASVREDSQLFSKLKQLLETNYREQHYPAYYADMLALSFKKLNELCKINCGLTMSSLIRDRLILEAKRLLLHSDYSIKEISYFLGFEDPAYFNRFFRKHISLSAGSFRKQNRIQE